MNTVFALHEPVYFDKASRTMVPRDLSKATEFGKLSVVFPGLDLPPPIEECSAKLAQAMKHFKPTDYLLLGGDMDLVVFAAVLAAKNTGGKLKLLKWDGRMRKYYEVEAPPGLLS